MRNILEQAIVHLLNEENDKAEALMHKFIVQRSRQIHESLRQGEDEALNDGWDDEVTTESYFTEADLEDFEDGASVDGDAAGEEVAGDDVDGDVDVDGDEEVAGDEVAGDEVSVDDAADDLEGDLGVDGEGDEAGDTEGRIEDLEDRLEALKAEFEALMGSDEGDADVDFDADVDGDVDADAEVDADADADLVDGDADLVDGMEDDMKDPVEEDFSSLSESIAAELEKISISLTDGKEIADGGSISQNGKSPISGAAKANSDDAGAAAPKPESNTSFEREPAPASKDLKKAKNTKAKATDGQSTVSKDGDKGALLNKDFAGKSAK